jgi:hypothetical protein
VLQRKHARMVNANLMKALHAFCLVLVAGSPGAFGSTLHEGLLAHLPLTADLRDHSTNHTPVQLVGKVEISDGAAHFGGESNWLVLPHLPLNKGPFAVAMWVTVTGKNPMYGLIEQEGARRRNQWLHLMLRGTWQPFLGQFLNDAVSPVIINPRKWTHLVFQHDAERQQIWIDGAPVVFRKCEPYEGSSGSTYLGKSPRWNNVPSQDFEGFMRDVRIYGRALRAEEIAELGGGEKASSVAPLSVPEVERNVRARNIGVPLLAIDGNKLLITGEASQVLDLEMAESLGAEWQPFMTLTNHFGRLELVDAQMPSSGRRFYRIKVRGALPVPY